MRRFLYLNNDSLYSYISQINDGLPTKVTKTNNFSEEKDKEIKTTETDFLNEEFKDISISSLPIDSCLIPIIENRIEEIKKCLSIKAPLSTIFLIGSTLEGVLLGLASRFPII